MNCLNCGEPAPDSYSLKPDEAEREDRIDALESALEEIMDGCEQPSARAKQALGYADVPPGDPHYDGDPLDPDDPCSPHVQMIEGEQWSTVIPHDLGTRYSLGGKGQLMGVYCKRCGRLWDTAEFLVGGG